MTLTIEPTRRPWRAACRGPRCGKMIEWWCIGYKLRPKLGRVDPRFHAYDLVVDIGTGTLRTNQRSHHLSCVDAGAFGGPEAAKPFPVTPPPVPSLEPVPRPSPNAKLDGFT